MINFIDKQLTSWLNQGWLSQLDRAFAQFLAKQNPGAEPLAIFAAALVSHQISQGQVYLDLKALVQNPELSLSLNNQHGQLIKLATDDPLKTTRLTDWINCLQNTPLLVDVKLGNSPLVLDLTKQRLYLRRYWQYQQDVNHCLAELIKPIRTELACPVIAEIQRLFPSANPNQIDWQKIACVLALRARFSIITGGPGTGKTTTVTKLLASLIKLAKPSLSHPYKIILAAPTGKAAARVSESISQAVAELDLDAESKALIPRQASTLHSLLGSIPNTRRFKHHENNPLLADVVIVDEASMIDLEMMAALLMALPKHCSLILLGDKDQLASVEPGSVLGDLCAEASAAAYDASTRQWLADYAGLNLNWLPNQSALNQASNPYSQQIIVLQHSHRFGADSGIGALAAAVNAGDYLGLAQILNLIDSKPSQISYTDLDPAIENYHAHKLNPQAETANQLLKLIVLGETGSKNPGLSGYAGFQKALSQQQSVGDNDEWAAQVIKAFEQFRVLSGLRNGPWGVDGLNQRIEQYLFGKPASPSWYLGRPIMITRNDYSLGLMNGDIGITLADDNGKLRVAFSGNPGLNQQKIHWVSPLRLPAVETAYAMTIHKAQGSEFNQVVLVLPETQSLVLSRELIYTGITRAKQQFILLESRAGILKNSLAVSCR